MKVFPWVLMCAFCLGDQNNRAYSSVGVLVDLVWFEGLLRSGCLGLYS